MPIAQVAEYKVPMVLDQATISDLGSEFSGADQEKCREGGPKERDLT